MNQKTKTLLLLIGLSTLVCCFFLAIGQAFLAMPGSPAPAKDTPAEPADAPAPSEGIKATADEIIQFTRAKWNYTWRQRDPGNNQEQYIGQSPSEKQKVTLWTESGENDDLLIVRITFRIPTDGTGQTVGGAGLVHLKSVARMALGHWSQADDEWLLSNIGTADGPPERNRGNALLVFSSYDDEPTGDIVIMLEIEER